MWDNTTSMGPKHYANSLGKEVSDVGEHWLQLIHTKRLQPAKQKVYIVMHECTIDQQQSLQNTQLHVFIQCITYKYPAITNEDVKHTGLSMRFLQSDILKL